MSFAKLKIDKTKNDKSKCSCMTILCNLNDFLSIFYCIMFISVSTCMLSVLISV